MKRTITSAAAAMAAVLVLSPSAFAEVRVSALIGDHMVIQQGRPVRLSGSAAPGEAVRAAFGPHSAETRADASGRWLLGLPAMAAGGPHELTIAGDDVGEAAQRFGDIWVGEVWIASGQSNMELALSRTKAIGDGAAGDCQGMRLFVVAHTTAAEPKTDLRGRWQVCDAASADTFSAVAFHFGRELHRALGVPVGLVQATWGGTPAEAWTPRDALVAEPELLPMVEAFDRAIHDPAVLAEVAAQRTAWEARSFHQDGANKGEAEGYARRGRAARGWSKMALPQVWEHAGLPIDGAVWFRREVRIPAEWTRAGPGGAAATDLALSLGPIDDFDVTYWNGERVGATGAETPDSWVVPRRYVVPARLVKPGRNVIAVRVFDHYGDGGFAGAAAQMSVGPDRMAAPSLPLNGTWSYKVESSLPPAVVDWGTRPGTRGAYDPVSPTGLWNGMIAPIAETPAAGVIWYQGEANVARAAQYRTLFPTLIRAWRVAWHDPALPFLFVQLPGYGGDASASGPLGQSPWADLREAQAQALALSRTAMAVTLDIGESGGMHPRNKHDVGRRLALLALRDVYGDTGMIASGPAFATAVREEYAMRVRFAPGTTGLITSDGQPPRGFILAGADRIWRPADARIDGDSVIVSSPEVPEPVAVRYGWADDPLGTLRNQADLPAGPFRSDDW